MKEPVDPMIAQNINDILIKCANGTTKSPYAIRELGDGLVCYVANRSPIGDLILLEAIIARLHPQVLSDLPRHVGEHVIHVGELLRALYAGETTQDRIDAEHIRAFLREPRP
jgi:hypothetical protein